LLAVLIPIALFGVVLLGAVLFIQRGASGLDASPRQLLRMYLYLGSLVSVIVLVAGIAQAITGVLGAIAPDFTYGQQPVAVPAPVPPGSEVGVPLRPGQPEQNDRRTRESLLQGITGAVAGTIFWAVHWYGRKALETADERTSFLRRGYYLLGTAIFGIASIVLVPTAIYNTLHWFLIPVGQFDFRGGAGESVAAAIAAVPFWIIFLRIVLTDYRAAPAGASAAPRPA
jgi:hypothetical protein